MKIPYFKKELKELDKAKIEDLILFLICFYQHKTCK